MSRAKILTNTSYCIRIMWQPRRLVGGSGGTNSCSDFQSSVSPALIFPRDTAASSRDSVSITLFFVMYWIVSVREPLVPFMVTLLWLSIVAQILIASPGTYPPLSNLTRHVTGPVVMQVMPNLCSISQWKGCCKIWSDISCF